jgi:hypothetical protein
LLRWASSHQGGKKPADTEENGVRVLGTNKEAFSSSRNCRSQQRSLRDLGEPAQDSNARK